jgi:hypothetical protein
VLGTLEDTYFEAKGFVSADVDLFFEFLSLNAVLWIRNFPSRIPDVPTTKRGGKKIK